MEQDFLAMLVPNVPRGEQSAIVEAMRPIWAQIDDLRKDMAKAAKSIQKHVKSTLTGK